MPLAFELNDKSKSASATSSMKMFCLDGGMTVTVFVSSLAKLIEDLIFPMEYEQLGPKSTRVVDDVATVLGFKKRRIERRSIFEEIALETS